MLKSNVRKREQGKRHTKQFHIPPPTFRVSIIDTFSVFSAQGVGLKPRMRREPNPENMIRTVANACFVSSLTSSSFRKRKKARVFPINNEDMFMAQKTPEFLVIVVGSELLARKAP